MRIKIIFSGIKDADIISVCYHTASSGSISDMIHDALAAYVRSREFSITIPDDIHAPRDLGPISINIPLNDVTDRDIISMLQQINPGYRAIAVKSIIRFYFNRPCILQFRDTASVSVVPKTHQPRLPSEKTENPQHNVSDNIPAAGQAAAAPAKDEDIFADGFITNY